MTISDNGLALIEQFEGCVLKVYLDPIGIKTAGVGHTGADVNTMAVGTAITQAQADAWLRNDVKKAEANVSSFDGTYHWNQNQFDALVSFAFNCGSINQLVAKGTRTIEQISDRILAYNKASGKVLAGLTRRRKAEKKLFDTPYKSEGTTTKTKNTVSVQYGYGIGSVYTLTTNLYVRDAANGKKKKLSTLTTDGKSHAYADGEGNAILRKGTKATAKAVQTVGNDIWLQIPSGWIAAKMGAKVYVK